MTQPPTKHITPLVLAMALVASTALILHVSEAKFVQATNGLSNGKTLQIHCKSRDDDLGVYLLRPGEKYQFRFMDNFWGTTQFYCGFVFDGKLHWFDIYIANRDFISCGEARLCLWMINDGGPCMFDYALSGGYTLCYEWNNNI